MEKTLFRSTVFLASMILSSVLAATSCSLKYDQTVYVEDRIPEFVFEGAEFTRYEKYKRSVQLKADRLEQYKDTAAAYARAASFYTWESDLLDTEGSCVYLSINTKDGIYSMFNDILIHNYSQDLEIKTQNLRWNSNTEQLTAGAGETVYISHEGLTMEGSGFSASGISRTYSFDFDVMGVFDDSPEDQDSPSDSDIES